MSKQCPFCLEDIKFDSKRVKKVVRKCPHCHELIHPVSCFVRFRESLENSISSIVRGGDNRMNWCRLNHKKVSRFIFNVIFAIAIGVIVAFLSSLPEKWALPYWWILGAIAFIITLTALTRPLNVQMVVVIAFVALIFNGIGILWQKENFDLRNRPYIGMIPKYFDMTNETTDGKNKIFTFKVELKNSGDIGAILEDFEYIPFVVPNNKFLDAGVEKITAINLRKLNENFGMIGWKNVPVLPKDLIEQEIINNPFGITDFQLLGGDNSDVFFWLKATYRSIGEKKRFYFWTIIKSKGSSEFSFVNSGENNRNFAKEYNIPLQ